MSGYGIYLVASQEFRVRLRTGRWQWLLGAWVLVVAVFTGLVYLALQPSGDDPVGVPLFGALMLFVLALALVVSPAITAQSINGDRERGTLATLQITRLTAADIAVGKLVAGWGVGLGALGLTVPFVGLSVLGGGVGVVRAIAVLVVVALLIGVVCAVSMGLSALLPRSITSALLSYVVVFALTFGTLIAFGLGQALAAGSSYGSRPDRVWWLLAPNPFVVLADAAPALPPRYDPRTGEREYNNDDPLGEIGQSARSARHYHRGYYDENPSKQRDAVWPFGLGFNLLLGAGAVAVTIRRLRTPTRSLPKGVRVA